MLNLPGYTDLEEISSSSRSTVYRGLESQNKAPVIIKVLNIEQPSQADLAKIKREYELTKDLSSDGVLQPLALLPFEENFALILEDFGGVALSTLIASKKLDLLFCLQIAMKLTETLGKIHQQHIIHKDIKPSNIIINENAEQVKISDFSIAARVASERQSQINPDLLEGSLKYIPPEQTGRINRSIDHRADLYSFGVTLYEILTGFLPFTATDAMELIHCHMAISPKPPSEVDNAIPQQISDIIIKLLSKNAEERYQSAFGLRHDLEYCYIMLKVRGEIPISTLGKKDIPTTLHIPEKIYGRENEIRELFAALFQASRGRTEFLLVMGPPGIGKSALINELRMPVIKLKGFFASGKYDQFKRDEPYNAIKQAFQELCRQILGERKEKIASFRDKLRTALGQNGRIITDLIPEVELIIGEQPVVEILPPTQSQNRFNMVFTKFVKVFADQKHPLVLFLDDMQWADWASLKLVDLLTASTELRSLLIIGAYRDNEVSPSHPLALTLSQITAKGFSHQEIKLGPLQSDGLVKLLIDTLACKQSSAKSLADLVISKTNGNPFFVSQYLRNLYKQRLLVFDQEKYAWQWDDSRIRATKISSNVADFMVNSIRELTPEASNILSMAACIGSQFDLGLLTLLNGSTIADTATTLQEPQHAGLIMPIDPSYKYLETYTEEETAAQNVNTGVTYIFLHDRIQQAAFSLLTEEKVKKLHYMAGKAMQELLPPIERNDKLFEIAQHLNMGAELYADHTECIELAELNLEASRRAKISNAYETAIQFADSGIDLFDKKGWQDNYELLRDLFLEKAECDYLVGNLDEAEMILESVLDHVQTPEEKANIFNMKVVLYTHLDRQREAAAAGYNGLQLLGIHIPENPTKLIISLEFSKAFIRLRGRTPEDLVDLPEMDDPNQKLAIHLIMNMISSAYLSNQDLFAFLCLKGFNLTLQHGVSELSPYMLNSYAFSLADNFDAYESAYDFGMAGFTLNERLPSALMRSNTTALFGFFFSHWRRPFTEGIGMVKDAFRYCVEAGDFVFAGYSYCTLVLYLLAQGKNIDELQTETESYMDFVKRSKDQFSINFQTLKDQLLKNLKGLTENELSLNDASFNEERALQGYRDEFNANLLFHYYSWKGLILYLNGETAGACSMFETGKQYAHGVALLPSVADYTFYYCLAITACYPEMSSKEQRHSRKILSRNCKKLSKWTANCADNFLHKYLLVQAEISKIHGRQRKALDLYGKAIEAAEQYGFVQVEALANELSARLHLARGQQSIARIYLLEACRCYRQWGATAKVNGLCKKYELSSPTELIQASDKETVTEERATTYTTSGSIDQVDLTAVLKASQTISEDIVINKLLQDIMQIMIQNAGAQKGFLVLEENDKLFIEAEGYVDKADIEVKVRLSQPVEASRNISVGIINNVKSTMEVVVLKNASQEGPFVSDSYVIENQPKSILCLPIIKQKKFIGILYLENNLLSDAFTLGRLEVLSMLATQAAISLENAKLYEDMEQQVSQLQQAEETQQKLYSQLLQAQKMEAVGRLAGGVAHDFNNLLTSILGYSELALKHLPEDHPVAGQISIIRDAGEKAEILTRQLLAFSRKQVLSMSIINLNMIIDNIVKLLNRVIGEDILLEVNTKNKVKNVKADPGQVEQVLMNLVVNARDAMQGGGRLNIETADVYLDDQYVMDHEGVEAGPYVMLAVTDTGCGIDNEVMEKIFEPFFTTKGMKGTGLGLATIYGIIKQHNGHISVHSEPNAGTTFKIYFPATAKKTKDKSLKAQPAATHGTETILVVDDESSVLRLIKDALLPLGYKIFEASCANEALQFIDTTNESIDLLLTDMIMPGKNGRELAEQAQKRLSSLKVIYMSGYTDDVIADQGVLADDEVFLQKPLTLAKLETIIREVLDK